MKALSLTQPWATLVMAGAKQVETRSWSTSHRGWIAIHAAKTFPRWAIELGLEEPFCSALARAGVKQLADLPRGAILGAAHLHAVGQITRRSDGAVMVRTAELPIIGDELAFGDYTPGRFGWRFTNLRPLAEPIPCKGALGLWELPPAIAAVLEERL